MILCQKKRNTDSAAMKYRPHCRTLNKNYYDANTYTQKMPTDTPDILIINKQNTHTDIPLNE